jgi:hypothetical protein
MMQQGLPLAEIVKQFHMNEYKGWDRESHFAWIAETLYRELQGQGPQIAKLVEQRLKGTILQVGQEGRRLTVRNEAGEQVRLRITSDTDIVGVADRSQLKDGMAASALYVVPQGANAALGFDVYELTVSP